MPPDAPTGVDRLLFQDFLPGDLDHIEVMGELFPHADLFTLLHVPGTVSPVIENRRIVTTLIAPALPSCAEAVTRADARHRLAQLGVAISRYRATQAR